MEQGSRAAPIKAFGRILLGALISAVATSLLGAIAFWLIYFISQDGASGSFDGIFLVTVVLAFVFCVPATIFLAVPTSYILDQLEIENGTTLSIVGALAGAVVLQLALSAFDPLLVGTGALFGAINGLIWWKVRKNYLIS